MELTVYCAHDCVGQGVGGRLYKALLDGVRQRGYCNAVALVTGQNKESCAFHKALGFKKIGVEPRTGYKFGQWLDLAYWCVEWVTYQLYSSATAAASSGAASRRVMVFSAVHWAARASFSGFGSFFRAASRFRAALLSVQRSA